MHIMRAARVFPRGDTLTTLIYFPLLARFGPLAGADKAILSVRGSASLAPAFLAVMIFHCNIRPLPAAGYHGFLYLYVRPFIAADTALYLGIRCSSRTR